MTYDEEADAAYIKFVQTGEDERLTTATMEERPIHFDFDEKGQFVAVEVLHASKYLPEELLAKAKKL